MDQDDELFQTQETDITGDLMAQLKNLEDPNTEIRLSSLDMNNGNNLVSFMRLFGVTANSMSYSQLMQELSLFFIEPQTNSLKDEHASEISKLELKLKNLREQLKDLNVEPLEDSYIMEKELTLAN